MLITCIMIFFAVSESILCMFGLCVVMISAVLHWVAATQFVLVLQRIDNKLLY